MRAFADAGYEVVGYDIDAGARERLAGLGELRVPSVADLFVAKVKGATA